jgi:hypothetical protein
VVGSILLGAIHPQWKLEVGELESLWRFDTMKRKRAFCLMLSMAFAVVLVMGAGAKEPTSIPSSGLSGIGVGQYRALLIGINTYEDPTIERLKTAVPDVQEVEQTLVNYYGFENTIRLLDQQATRKAIDQTFRKMIEELTPADSLLIYYAGHGDLDRLTKDGWWVPYDAKAGDPTTYLDNTVIQKYIGAMKSRHVLLVSDSCYSGTLLGETRALPPVISDQFYKELYENKSRWGMTSGNKTPVTDSGSEGHSLFAYHFLKVLKSNAKPYLTPREMYAKIGPVVRNNSEQMPVCLPIRNTGDEGGEFVFFRMKSSDETPQKPAPNYTPHPPQPSSENQTQRAIIEAAVFYVKDGKLQPLKEGMTLHSKDNYVLYLKPREDVYVYIFKVDTNAQAFKLFPNKQEYKTIDNPLRAGGTYWIPSEDKFFFLDDATGKEEIFFFASKKPVPALEQANVTSKTKIEETTKLMGVGGVSENKVSASAVVKGKSLAFDMLKTKISSSEDLIYSTWFWHK